MPTISFETTGADAAAAGWAQWGDQLDVGARTMRLELGSVGLDGWSGEIAPLSTAARELWTLAEFTRRVRRAAEAADGTFPADAADVDVMWERAASTVAVTMPLADGANARAARSRWLRTADDHEVREFFEQQFGTDPAEVLVRLAADDAVLYWDALPAADRAALIDARPDLVVFEVLANGARLDDAELLALDRSNAFPVFTTEFGLEVEASVGLRVVSIEVGAGVTLIVSKRSDGSVEMTFVEEIGGGVGVEIDVPRAAEASVSGGVFGQAQQTFRFADEATAAAAVEALRDAVSQDASVAEALKDAGGSLWNISVVPTNAAIWSLNVLSPFPDVPAVPTYDLTPATVARLRELWAGHGLRHQEGIGTYREVSAEFEAGLGAIEAGMAASAETRLMFYDSDAATADVTGAAGQTGVMYSGVATIDIEGRIPAADSELGGHATGEVGFLVDLHHVDDTGTFLTVTVHGDVGAGTDLDLLDARLLEVGSHVDRTAAMTATLTVPVNAETADAVGRIGVDLARGRAPSAGFRELYDVAEIDVTIATGVTSTTEIGVDVVAVEASMTQTSSLETTRVALHKYPDGRLFSRVEADELIDAAQPR